jgi:hypothetical protein
MTPILFPLSGAKARAWIGPPGSESVLLQGDIRIDKEGVDEL